MLLVVYAHYRLVPVRMGPIRDHQGAVERQREPSGQARLETDSLDPRPPRRRGLWPIL